MLSLSGVNSCYCSGHCGMYAIKHIEQMVMQRELDNIKDETMVQFRQEEVVDIFNEFVTP